MVTCHVHTIAFLNEVSSEAGDYRKTLDKVLPGNLDIVAHVVRAKDNEASYRFHQGKWHHLWHVCTTFL